MVIIMRQLFINCYQFSCLWMTLMLIIMTSYLTYSLTICNNYEVPKQPPRIDAGGFESIKTFYNPFIRDVIIYWTPIKDVDKCSTKSFQYIVLYAENSKDPSKIFRTVWAHSCNANMDHAIITGLNTSIEYTFTIYSKNEHGSSVDFSTITVPSESDQLVQPIIFQKPISVEPGSFEVSWINIDNNYRDTFEFYKESLYDGKLIFYYFTIFWCENDQINNPNQCNGNINFIPLQSFESTSIIPFRSKHNVTGLDPTKNYKFAISISGQIIKYMPDGGLLLVESSSGMMWEPCIPFNNTEHTLLKKVWAGLILSHAMIINWKLDCFNWNLYLPVKVDNCEMTSINCDEPWEIIEDYSENYAIGTNFLFIKGTKPKSIYRFFFKV